MDLKEEFIEDLKITAVITMVFIIIGELIAIPVFIVTGFLDPVWIPPVILIPIGLIMGFIVMPILNLLIRWWL